MEKREKQIIEKRERENRVNRLAERIRAHLLPFFLMTSPITGQGPILTQL